jgi:hypothetical protein
MEGIERFENFGNKKSLKVELSLEGFGAKRFPKTLYMNKKMEPIKIPKHCMITSK